MAKQGLEADSAPDNPAVVLRQRHIHRNVAAAQPLGGLCPVLFAVGRQDGLNDRDVPFKKPGWNLRFRGQGRIALDMLGKTGRIDNDMAIGLFDQMVDCPHAIRIFQGKGGNRKDVELWPREFR